MSLAGAKGVERPSEHRLGVLFEISIVCHVLCSWFWRGGWGFSLFWGLFWLVRRVFSGFWGSLRFSFVLLLLVGVGAGCGGSGVRGLVRPGGLLPSCWGAGLGCACARLSGLLPPCWGGRVRGCARRPVPAVLWWGSGCARFPVRVRGVVVVFAGGFRVLFFPSGASRVLLVSGVGLRGLAGGRGVVGGVGLGSGLFFLRLLLYWPGLVSGFLLWGAGLGLGWVLFGEFDPGSGRTLAACLTHASRTGPPSFLGGGLSGERVSIT